MSERTVEAVTAEAEAVATLHALNAEYIRAFLESDVAWYADHLSDDFVCTLADGRRIGKAEFLDRAREGPGVTDLTYDEIDVRPVGESAIVHGVTHYRREARSVRNFPLPTAAEDGEDHQGDEDRQPDRLRVQPHWNSLQ